MSDFNEAPNTGYHESDFILRHKAEALNMFELLDHLFDNRNDFDLALDVGGGFGDHLPFVADRIGMTFAADIIDFLVDERFAPRQVASRTLNFGGRMNLDRVAFHKCDAQKLFYRDQLFDLVFSINAFEHIPNPVLALSEAIRVARKGAPIYIQFDPIWNSPIGHHLPHLVTDPWRHLLMDEAEFIKEIQRLGGSEIDIIVFKTAMNRKPFSYYERIFLEDFKDCYEIASFATWSGNVEDEPSAAHPNYDSCIAKGYSPKELITRGVQFVGVKK